VGTQTPDIVGNYGGNVSGSDNRNIGLDYSGWIDLFGFGTGDWPTNRSTSSFDYDTFSDWGANAVSNGGNAPNLWRTLTKDEWDYLLDTRANASDKKATGSVNGVHGLILLPDNWTLPSGCTFNAGLSSEVEDWSLNSYSLTQWAAMEAAGAIFLPAAGSRYVQRVDGVGVVGGYWSSTSNGEDNAYCLDFHGAEISTEYNTGCHFGLSVRLVH